MKKLLFFCMGLAACASFGDFAYQSTLTVGGYAGSTALSNFPVLVRISPERIVGFSYDQLREDGLDMRFTSLDGATVYPHAIDTWNRTGESLIWVKVPSLAGTTTQFRFEYGDSAYETAADATGVWNGAAGGYYAGVWHFGEEIDAAAAPLAVSADSARHDGTGGMGVKLWSSGSSRAAEATSTNGVIGTARVNQLATEGYKNGFWAAHCPTMDLGTKLTVSMWVRCMVANEAGYRLMTHKNGWQGTDGWELNFEGNTQTLLARGSDGAYVQTKNVPSSRTDWLHIAAVYDGATATVYANGLPLGTGSLTAIADNVKDLYIGCEYGHGNPFPGAFDEVRLLGASASADWVKAEYDTVRAPSFVTATPALPVRNALAVQSSSGEYGTVSPTWGVHTEYADGETVHCAAPSGVIVVSEDLRVTCVGWTLYGDNGSGQEVVLDSGTTTSFDYTYRDGPMRRLVWDFAEKVPLTLSAPTGCSFVVNGEAVASGTVYVPKGMVTVRPVAGSGQVFLRWEGTLVDANFDVLAEQTLSLEGPCALTAVFSTFDAAHVARIATWQGSDGGSWHVAANWGGELPGPGDTIILANCGTVVVTEDVPHLAALTVGNGATLVVSNWYSRLSADAVTVGQGGMIGTFGYLLNAAARNRVWLSGGTLTVASGGRIVADGAGYAGTNGPCWTAEVTYKLYDAGNGRNVVPFGGAYGGRQGFRRGAQLSGNYSWKSTFVTPEPYGSAEWPFALGSGGGSFIRSGGGAIYLDFSGVVTIDGTVSANASEAGYANFPAYESNGNAAEGVWNYLNTSYGSGGGIVIRCGSIAGAGAVQANSGRYTATRVGLGGGSGGRIAVHYDGAMQAQASCTVRFEARGGSTFNYNVHDPYLLGDPGTLWFPDNGFLESYKASGYRFTGVWSGPKAAEVTSLTFDGDALFDGAGLVLPALRSLTVGGNLSLLGDDTTKPAIAGVNALKLTDCDVAVAGDVIVKGARLELAGGSLTVDGNLTLANLRNSLVNGGGELLVTAAATNETRIVGALLTVGGKLTVEKNAIVWPQICTTDGAYVKFAVKYLAIEAGGQVSADYRGCPQNSGPGTGYAQYGASHGGRGGSYSSNLQWVTNPYGSGMYPLEAGSGGNDREGAGVICIEASRHIQIDGAVHANAKSTDKNWLCHDYTTGAAGGSVFLSALSVGGTGTVSANGGGDGYAYGDYGMGAGGRIAFWTTRTVTVDFKSRVTVTGGTCKSAVQLLPEDGTIYYGSVPGAGLILQFR